MGLRRPVRTSVYTQILDSCLCLTLLDTIFENNFYGTSVSVRHPLDLRKAREGGGTKYKTNWLF